jgi:hypothetical protein
MSASHQTALSANYGAAAVADPEALDDGLSAVFDEMMSGAQCRTAPGSVPFGRLLFNAKLTDEIRTCRACRPP